MFGYLIKNPQNMGKEDSDRYQEAYCGLCNRLYNLYGALGRRTLSYDLTFVELILDGIYNPVKTRDTERCPLHPIKKHPYRYSEITEYAAAMNILLTYYKQLDDYHDDNDQKAYRKSEKLQPFVDQIRKAYPRQYSVIEKCLNDISAMEKDGLTNPDLPANAFGVLMSELFIYKEDEHATLLKGFGFHLGKFIYLYDAYLDLKDDLKKQRYNPLTTIDTSGFKEVLEAVLADCLDFYDKLPMQDNRSITDNILLSGIWTAYIIKHRRDRKELEK